MNLFNFDEINSFAIEPEENADFNHWILQKDMLQYLENEANDEYIIIYASLPHTYIYTVLIPDVEPEEHIINDLLKWNNCNPFSSWGISCSSDSVCIEPPLSSCSSGILETGEQIIFARSFEGSQKQDTYYEINQEIAHVLEIHFVQERNAWCKLDKHGDLDDIFKIIKIDSFPKNQTGTIICLKKEALGEYAGIRNLKLIRMFDFTRYKSGDFIGWNDTRKASELSAAMSIFGSLTVDEDTGSYSRGFQFIDIKVPTEQVINNIWEGPDATEEKQYCTYIAEDWKNKVISEISCNPLHMSNYFVKSDLPLEMSPAFFKPEVLLKYKSDRTKYRLDARSVYCRGSWELRTFDINSAGQVHTYLIYLSNLPYEEQLHWKQYNEKPKASISERAIKNDFKGEFWDEYEPLPSLKYKLEKLHSENVNWWKLRDEDATDKVQYPYTASRDEWAEEILNLDQLLVEGLEEKWLRKKTKELGCDSKAQDRSLKLIELILVALGFEQDHAKEIMSSFRTVHYIRSRVKGHTLGTEAEEIRKNSLKEFGSYRKHFEKLCTDCDESLEIITSAFERL